MQWLIDIIKEWIISEGCLTPAEMLEWITPVNVTGTLTPDATCTYFKAGTYNEKPYYRRADGAYFIWWFADANSWYITSVPGSEEEIFWIRMDPDIPGIYEPGGTASGTATVSMGYKYLCAGFIDRGDPTAFDFTTGDFTWDGNWHELDLSAIVPQNAKAVLFAAQFLHGGGGQHFKLRKHGNTNEKVISDITTQYINRVISPDLVVACDAGRKIDCWAGPGFPGTINLTVKGWWF